MVVCKFSNIHTDGEIGEPGPSQKLGQPLFLIGLCSQKQPTRGHCLANMLIHGKGNGTGHRDEAAVFGGGEARKYMHRIKVLRARPRSKERKES